MSCFLTIGRSTGKVGGSGLGSGVGSGVLSMTCSCLSASVKESTVCSTVCQVVAKPLTSLTVVEHKRDEWHSFIIPSIVGDVRSGRPVSRNIWCCTKSNLVQLSDSKLILLLTGH